MSKTKNSKKRSLSMIGRGIRLRTECHTLLVSHRTPLHHHRQRSRLPFVPSLTSTCPGIINSSIRSLELDLESKLDGGHFHVQLSIHTKLLASEEKVNELIVKANLYVAKRKMPAVQARSALRQSTICKKCSNNSTSVCPDRFFCSSLFSPSSLTDDVLA